MKATQINSAQLLKGSEILAELKICCHYLAYGKFNKAETRLGYYMFDQKLSFSHYDNMISPLIVLVMCERSYQQLSVIIGIYKDISLSDLYMKTMYDFDRIQNICKSVRLKEFACAICILVSLIEVLNRYFTLTLLFR